MNRLDTAVIYFPVVFLMWRWRGMTLKLGELIGVLPLLAWLAFAKLYYGFAFPNTKFAKLAEGVPRSFYFEAGKNYLLDLVSNDPASIAIIVVALLVFVFAVFSKHHNFQRGRSDRYLCGGLVAGIVLYLAYVVWIGGDFMAGRHVVLPLFAAACLLLYLSKCFSYNLVLLVAVIFLAAILSRPETHPENHRALDHRAYYAKRYSLVSVDERGQLFIRKGLSDHYYLAEHDNLLSSLNGDKVLVVRGAVGIFGFYAGPNVTIIDNYALTDALLARLPPKPRVKGPMLQVGIGHIPRGKPAGYLEARVSNDPSLIDSSLYPMALN